MLTLRLAELPALLISLAHSEPERRIADGAAHEYAVARLGAGAANHSAFRDAAEHRNGNRDWPGRAVGIAAEQRTAEQHGIATQALCKSLQPLLADVLGQRERQQEAERPSAFGGQVRQIHAQRLAGNRMGRVVGKEMHAADDGIRFENQIATRRRREKCGIVRQPQRAGMRGERLEETRDQAILG